MSRSLPKRLYKYQPFSTQALVNLKLRRVWFSQAAKFNDPFDCALGVKWEEVTDTELRRLWEAIRGRQGIDTHSAHAAGYLDDQGHLTEKFRKEVFSGAEQTMQTTVHQNRHERGVTCFSENPNDPLLWAHYGGGHRGFCLEFDTAADWFERVYPVRYDDELPSVNVVDALMDPGSTRWLDLLLTKAKCWEYENEWRAIHQEPDKLYTYDWKHLTGVYLGALMDSEHQDMIGTLLHGSETQLYRVEHDPGQFTLTAVPVDYTPYQFDTDV